MRMLCLSLTCLLASATLARADDLLPPGKPIPVVYYESRKGDFVRADVTYLKQDFSAMLAVVHAFPWPDVQRYDYLLRTRELGVEERAVSAAREALRGPTGSRSYPQKEAVRFALEQLRTKKPSKRPD